MGEGHEADVGSQLAGTIKIYLQKGGAEFEQIAIDFRLRFSITPARVIGHGEDWDRSEPVLFREGEVMQFRFGGEALRLRRQLEAPIVGNILRIPQRGDQSF